jgi:hypothetical protein
LQSGSAAGSFTASCARPRVAIIAAAAPQPASIACRRLKQSARRQFVSLVIEVLHQYSYACNRKVISLGYSSARKTFRFNSSS